MDKYMTLSQEWLIAGGLLYPHVASVGCQEEWCIQCAHLAYTIYIYLLYTVSTIITSGSSTVTAYKFTISTMYTGTHQNISLSKVLKFKTQCTYGHQKNTYIYTVQKYTKMCSGKTNSCTLLIHFLCSSLL